MELTQILFALVAPVIVSAACYNAGPAFPPVHRILREEHFDKLRATLDGLIPEILGNPDGWTINTTSYAIQVTSANQSLWNSYYTAPILGEYVDSEPTPVNGDTAFRIASVSKTFTVYAALRNPDFVSLDHSIAAYIPELYDLTEHRPHFLWEPDWDQITLRSLASQLSGIAREGGLSDLAADSDRLPDPESRGFPPVDRKRLAPCFTNTTDRACTIQETIWLATLRHKVFEINDRSTYSNMAFSLLGRALEVATGMEYSELIASAILEPLGMSNTRTTKPKDSMGVIPHGPNDWKAYLDAEIPSGGIYSTANDLTRYLQSILSATLLSRAKVNDWMKPRSWSTGIASAYGMPWEMYRVTTLTPDGRPIDFVTKGGDLTGYRSLIAMIPEFGLGITILVAGNPAAMDDLSERIIGKLVPAVEELLRSEVRAMYAGTYVMHGADARSSLKLEVDDVGPGLLITEWISNNVDFLPVYGSLKGMAHSKGNWEARLIPSEINVQAPYGKHTFETETWRLTAIQEKSSENKGKILEDFCLRDVDSLMYNGLSLEHFDLGMRSTPEGRRESGILRNLALRTVLIKSEDGRAPCPNYAVALGLPPEDFVCDAAVDKVPPTVHDPTEL